MNRKQLRNTHEHRIYRVAQNKPHSEIRYNTSQQNVGQKVKSGTLLAATFLSISANV